MKILVKKAQRPMTFKEWAKAMNLKKKNPHTVKLYLEYIVQHQKLEV